MHSGTRYRCVGGSPGLCARCGFTGQEGGPGFAIELGGPSSTSRAGPADLEVPEGQHNVAPTGLWFAWSRRSHRFTVGYELSSLTGLGVIEKVTCRLDIEVTFGCGSVAPCVNRGLPPEIRQGRSDRGSSPCSRPPQSLARTFAERHCIHRLPRWREAESSIRKQDRRRCLST